MRTDVVRSIFIISSFPVVTPLVIICTPKAIRTSPSFCFKGVCNSHNQTLCCIWWLQSPGLTRPLTNYWRDFPPLPVRGWGRPRVSSKFSGAAIYVSQQRSREKNNSLQLAAPRSAGVTATWGSPSDTITATLCWLLVKFVTLRNSSITATFRLFCCLR